MIQSTKPNPGKKIINVDQVTSMYLPDIPATRPTNENNLSVIIISLIYYRIGSNCNVKQMNYKINLKVIFKC